MTSKFVPDERQAEDGTVLFARTSNRDLPRSGGLQADILLSHWER